MKKTLLAAACMVLLAACGDSSTTPDEPSFTYELTVLEGAGQTARIGATVGAIRVRLLRGDGRPMASETISVSVASGGGSVGSTVSTDASGTALVSDWALGDQPGTNTLTITAPQFSASTSVTAEARYPRWTLMVYMAADNNLSLQGYFDLEEMEAAGFDPEVQVVVQGEFSPYYMQLDGVTPGLIGLDTYSSTFRYVLGDYPQRIPGIDGPVQYMGAVNMASQQALRDFVGWAKSVAPAERYLLVPWNHGAGFEGLLQDMTQAGNELMPLGEFRSALQGMPPFDIVDFDMCYMGGYEVLDNMEGIAEFVIVSEELVPGPGLPYHLVLNAIQADPTASTESVAGMLVNTFADYYEGSRASVTKSAYRMEGYPAFENALDAFAGQMKSDLSTSADVIDSALGEAQKFTQPVKTDIADLVRALSARLPSGPLRSAATTLEDAALSQEFLVANRRYSAPDDQNVDRATGLYFLFPSGDGEDRFRDDGRSSFDYYKTLIPGSPWSSFLENWTAAQDRLAMVDLGPGRVLEVYQVWDEATVDRGGDIDFWLWEPDERLWIPYLGVRSSTGTFSADSYGADTGGYFEGWLSDRYVQDGRYEIWAHQWTAPDDLVSQLDVRFRFELFDDFSSLYADDPEGFIQLSQAARIEDDATPTYDEVVAGAYTNIKAVAFWDPVAASSAPLRSSPPPPALAAPGLGPTDDDVARLKRLIERRARDREADRGPSVTRATLFEPLPSAARARR